jgi:hypothetical protein
VPLSIPSYAMPHVFDDTIILAATHPGPHQSNPTSDGWFISDFYAFNYLLKGLGKSQTWLTRAVSTFLSPTFYPLTILSFYLEKGHLALPCTVRLVISRKSVPEPILRILVGSSKTTATTTMATRTGAVRLC